MTFPPRLAQTLQQLIRYGIVGLVSNGIAYVMFLLIAYMGMEPKLAMTLVYLSTATIGFFGNRTWAFSHQNSFFQSAMKYVISHILGYAINLGILWYFVDISGYNYQLVQGAAIVAVALFLFLLFKLFVFAAPNMNNEEIQ